jgi:hypothetical protein
MQYSDTTNFTGIIQRSERLCNLGSGGISGNTQLLKEFTGLHNEAYNEIWMAGMSVDKHNRIDDYNYTDFPDATITMVLNQADYTLPVAVSGGNVASLLRIKGVYVTINGYRQYLSQMEDTDLLGSVATEPTKYLTNGKSIIFQYPFNAITLTKYGSVFNVEFQRVPAAFLYTDTTKVPGFMESYHDLIPIRAASKYLLPTNSPLSNQYDAQFYKRLQLFKRDITRFDDNSPGVITSETVISI